MKNLCALCVSAVNLRLGEHSRFYAQKKTFETVPSQRSPVSRIENRNDGRACPRVSCSKDFCRSNIRTCHLPSQRHRLAIFDL